jgi:hypothetical protein
MLLSNHGFKFNVRRYTAESVAMPELFNGGAVHYVETCVDNT